MVEGFQAETNGSRDGRQGRARAFDRLKARNKIKNSKVSHQDFRQDFAPKKNFLSLARTYTSPCLTCFVIITRWDGSVAITSKKKGGNWDNIKYISAFVIEYTAYIIETIILFDFGIQAEFHVIGKKKDHFLRSSSSKV
jgi:hypothetical protein